MADWDAVRCITVISMFFLFFSPFIKVELIKGNLQSVGLTLRLVQSTDGYAGHVIIETVAPNSPAAIADLQRGDRLIAIGGNYTLRSITFVYRETTTYTSNRHLLVL